MITDMPKFHSHRLTDEQRKEFVKILWKCETKGELPKCEFGSREGPWGQTYEVAQVVFRAWRIIRGEVKCGEDEKDAILYSAYEKIKKEA